MSSDASEPRIIANLLIGSDGATTLNGSSKALTNKADRERFHQLREKARAICIGGSTFRSEPYEKVPLPLYVSSRGTSVTLANLRDVYPLSPTELVKLALATEGAPILIEGGPNFLTELIESAQIDELHITRSPTSGDDNYFDETHLNQNYKCLESNEVDGVRFEIWSPINR